MCILRAKHSSSPRPRRLQVEAILWRYMGNAHRKAGLSGRITLDAKWYIGNELVAYGRKPADYDPAAFQGIRALVLVIIDEAGGVPKSIFDAVDALAANVDARVVAVGNPDDPASHFATICKPGSGWHVETISIRHTGVDGREGSRRSVAAARLTGMGRGTQTPLGASPARSINRRSWASSPTSPTTL
jgi:hypothetical protein